MILHTFTTNFKTQICILQIKKNLKIIVIFKTILWKVVTLFDLFNHAKNSPFLCEKH